MSFFRNLLNFIVLLICLSAISGCAGVDTSKVRASIAMETGLKSSAYIDGVPLISPDGDEESSRYYCGPTALASILSFYGLGVDIDEIAGKIYRPELKGAITMDVFLYAKERGLQAKLYRGTMEDLKDRIRAGTPPILFVDMGYGFFPMGHYIVPVGFSDDYGVVLAHSGSDEALAISYKRLLRAWKKTGYSTILIRPKQKR